MTMATLHTLQEGSGPVVVLSHALGCDLTMWDGVAARLATEFTVLRHDQRGHGKSAVVPGEVTIAAMAEDTAASIAGRVKGPVHFVGLSMGGMVGQQLAAAHPELVRTLVIANSASHYDEAARAMWRTRVETVLAEGVSAIGDGAMQRWFTPAFRVDVQGSRTVAAMRAVLEATDASAYAAACDAVSGIDFRVSNTKIACPALVIAGTLDEATPPSMSQAIRTSITGAELATLDAAHLSAVEQPAEFAALVARFIRAH